MIFDHRLFLFFPSFTVVIGVGNRQKKDQPECELLLPNWDIAIYVS